MQGFVSIFKEMFEQVEHKICLRHLYIPILSRNLVVELQLGTF